MLATETDPAVRGRMRRAQTINRFGAVMTGLVLVTVLITKFTLGAWIAIVAMVAIFVLMSAIRRHYDRVASELVAGEDDSVLPARNHAIVLVSKLHLATLRALAYARATRPDVLEGITVNVDDEETRRLVAEWERRDIPVRLKVIESPYREITRPVLEYVKRIRSDNPRDVVTVFIPEYVVGPLVGAAAAQPERAAAQGPAAVPAGRDGDQRAVAALLVVAGRPAAPAVRGRIGAPRLPVRSERSPGRPARPVRPPTVTRRRRPVPVRPMSSAS